MEQSGKEISEGLNPFLCNSLYNTCQIAEFVSSEYDRLSRKIMCLLFDVLSVEIDLGADRHMFYPAMYIRTWHRLLIGEVKDVVDPTKDEDVLMSIDLLTQKKVQFFRSRRKPCSM